MKILLQDHDPNFIKDGRQYYCRKMILAEGSPPPDGLFANVNCVFTEAQLRAAEKIPEDVKLPENSEWLKAGPAQRLVTKNGKAEGMEISMLYLRGDSWDRLLYAEPNLTTH